MPSKPAKGKPKPQEDPREEVLLAVVVADSFQSQFKPFTNDKPRCLLPLANTPILEYTLEFLASNGVQEVIIYGGNHIDKIEQYIHSSKWKKPYSPFQKISVFKTTATSIGDCMRDLDKRDLVSGDFLVVSGDVVSNVKLESALAAHRARRAKDKNAIMTMVLREVRKPSRLRRCRRQPLFVLDPQAERCLHYEEIGGNGACRYVTLDPDFLTSHAEIDVRGDLLDPHIDICTPDVLALWTENFDYQNPRTSFLYGVLKDYELNGKTIHTHLVRDQYAARVANFRANDAISRDVLARRAYPFCPDSNILEGQTYQSRNPNIYQETDVRIARTAKISGTCALGRNTEVGARSVISNSSLGRNCKIGSHVTIEDAQIWEDVTIEDHARIIGPVVIGNGVLVGSNVAILPGAVIASGVSVRKGANTPESGVIEQPNKNQHTISFSDDSDALSDASLGLTYKQPVAASSQSSISTFASSDDSQTRSDTSRRSSFVSDPCDEGTAANKDFLVEATASILDGLSQDQAPETILLELNGLRMTVNASQHQVKQAVAAAFVRRAAQLSEGGSVKDAVKSVLEKYVSLFERIIQDKEADEKADQVDLLLLVQKELIERANGDLLLLFVAKELYDLDILEQDGLLQWWDDPKSQEGAMGRVKGLTEKFVTFLREAEEDESSDEEDECG